MWPVSERRWLTGALAAALSIVTACSSQSPVPARSESTLAAVQSTVAKGSTTSQGQSAADEPLLRVAALGDVGTGDENELATAALVVEAGHERPFDALVLLGDNVYENGEPERLDATVFDPFADVLEGGAVLLPVLGNHDVRDGNAEGQVEAFGLPGRWYSEQIGPLLFIGLDSNLVDAEGQRAWLENVLAATEAAWTIVAMHHPAYSGGHHGSTEEIQEAWVPLFEEYGVDLVLAGHDHDYQRITPINGITYLVSGGGSRLRETGFEDFTAFARSVLHFLDIVVWEDRIEVSAISQDGVFDRTVIDAGALVTTGS